MIVVLDYGSGNLRSVAKGLEAVGGTVIVTGKPSEIKNMTHMVLPGVGAFADCLANLKEAGLVEPIFAHIRAGRPFLGICVGMQLLFSQGHEFGIHDGLDLIPGNVVRFANTMPDPQDPARHLKVPHMGWNVVRQTRAHPMWQGIADGSHFYFVHSFHGQPRDGAVLAGESEYGLPFAAAVAKDNLFATQFHPEKSQEKGLQMLTNFVQWKP